MSTAVTEELLFSYFADMVTPVQRQLIEKWLADPANEEVFFAALHKWETANLQYQANVNKGIRKFKANISDKQLINSQSGRKQVKGGNTKSFYRYGKWVAVASLLLMLVLNAYIFRKEILYKTHATDYGQTSRIILSDGSKVMLNANSVLSVPRFGFGNATRKVLLQGEACFSVVHTPDNKRFVVQTDSLFQVEVLGTEFDVFARPRKTKVVLMKGKVNVHYSPENKFASALTMTPGDMVSINKKQAKLEVKKVEQPENYTAWKHHRFIFDDTCLGEIKAIIQENYGLMVELKGKNLINRTVSGSFKAHSANEFLQAISAVLEIKLSRHNNKVVLIESK